MMGEGEEAWRWMGDPNDIGKALRNAAQRFHSDAAFIRRLRTQVGDHRDLEPEVEQALKVLVAWAAKMAKQSTPVPKEKPPPVEPGPLAAKPRLRQSNRRTWR